MPCVGAYRCNTTVALFQLIRQLPLHLGSDFVGNMASAT